MVSLVDLDAAQIEHLEYHISPELPFGPEHANTVKDADARAILFNQNNMLCRHYRHNPRIIVGRRGSGKPTIISNTSLIYDYDYVLQLVPEDTINTIKSIVYPHGAESSQCTESIAKVWKTALNTMLMAHIVKDVGLRGLPRVRAYLATCDIPMDTGIAATLAALRRRADQASTGLTGMLLNTFLDSLDAGNARYEDARNELDEYLAQRNLKAVVIVDSLEDYHLHEGANRDVMAGLLKCVGDYGNRRRHIRLCIPGEAYFDIKDCSKNALKDLTHNLLLHWLPSEIYSIIAWRYLLYKRLYDRRGFDELRQLSPTCRDDTITILNHLFPPKIKNSIGKLEPTLPYIMRHTQLLPRQVIVILNRIFCSPSAADFAAEVVDGVKIAESIAGVESTLCAEIFSAFRSKFPNAYEYCRLCIPEMPQIFDDAELHKVFNRHGRAAEKRVGAEMDYTDFKTMLVEMGAIGRVRHRAGLYAESEFEYAQPGRLNLSVDDTLCLHPLFSGEFRSSKNRADTLVVYPQKEWFDSGQGRSLRVHAV